jgi:hypothetical protein
MDEGLRLAVAHSLVRTDLFFLVRYILSTRLWRDAANRPAAHNQWVLDRCREVEQGGHDVLRIWSRYHWKSTLETFAFTLQELLQNPEETICIFSHTRPIAKTFLAQIRYELETNRILQRLSWDENYGHQIFYDDPRKQAQRWSLDDGIIVNRMTNPARASVEAWGLVDSQPTGARYTRMKYDDTVTLASVTTPEMIDKTTRAWEHSLNLGIPGLTQRRYIGTYYAFGDTYQEMEQRGVTVELRPAYEITKELRDEETGEIVDIDFDFDHPLYMEKDVLEEERRRMGEETFATQILCFPFAGNVEGLDRDWLEFYETETRQEREIFLEKLAETEGPLHHYILVDPATDKKKGSSSTVMWDVALAANKCAYVADCVWDRLDLSERVEKLFGLAGRTIGGPLIEVRYERYAFQADIDHIKFVMRLRNRYFKIREVGGIVQKDDRIRRLVPLLKDHRLIFPKKLYYKRVADSKTVDLMRQFERDEYTKWPKAKTADGLDALSRIAEPDLGLAWPLSTDDRMKRERSLRRRRRRKRHGWMGV